MWGDGRIYQRGRKFWIAYSVRGREVREPAGQTSQEAKKFLKTRLNQLRAGTLPGREAEALTVDDLLDALVSHLELRGAKSLVPVRSHLKPIRSRFGFSRALGVTAAQVQGFARERLALGKTRPRSTAACSSSTRPTTSPASRAGWPAARTSRSCGRTTPARGSLNATSSRPSRGTFRRRSTKSRGSPTSRVGGRARS